MGIFKKGKNKRKREEVLTLIKKKLSSLQGHTKSCCKFLSHRTYGRYLRLTKNGQVKIDKTKLRREERLDGNTSS